jgi:hypothetical protein
MRLVPIVLVALAASALPETAIANAAGLAYDKALIVSIVPWKGPEAPGSIPDTIKYRLAVRGVAGRSVALRASGVPKGWVASFCSDRVCAPFRVRIALPASGVKVVEFQLVPPVPKALPPKVTVTGNDGKHVASATT